MGKGMEPKKSYDDKKYKANYDGIDWSSTRRDKNKSYNTSYVGDPKAKVKARKNKQGLMGSKTRVHGDRKAKHTKKIHQEEIDDAI